MTRRGIIAGSAAWAVGVGLVAGACTGTETGNPFTSETGTEATTTDDQVAALGPSTGGVGVQAAWIDIGRIELVSCDDPAVRDSALDAPELVELVSGGGPLPAFASSASRYCRVLVGLATVSEVPPGAPAALAGRTLVVTGERVDGTGFELASAAMPAIDIPLSGGSGLDVGDDGVGVLIVFDVARWFMGVDLASATVDTDGVVHIDDSQNSMLLHTFESNLALGTASHEDLDRDGMLDADEPPLGHHGS